MTLLSDTLTKVSKVNHHVSKTSVSCETCSKSHTSSLQKRRDFFNNSIVKSPKRAIRRRLPPKLMRKSAKRVCRTRLPPKVTRPVSKSSASYETVSSFSRSHMSKSPKRAFCTRLPPQAKREAHQTSQPHDSPPLPRKVHFHKYCACHEK